MGASQGALFIYMSIKLEFSGNKKPSIVSSGHKFGKNGWDAAKIKSENKDMADKTKKARLESKKKILQSKKKK